MKAHSHYSQVQKRLGTENSTFEWPITLACMSLPLLMAFVSLAHLKLFGSTAGLAFHLGYTLLGLMPIILRFRTFSGRAIRSQNTFLALVGFPSTDFDSDAILRSHGSEMVYTCVWDPVSGSLSHVMIVQCDVFKRTSAGYRLGGKGPVVFAFDSANETEAFEQWFTKGVCCMVGENGPVLAELPAGTSEEPFQVITVTGVKAS